MKSVHFNRDNRNSNFCHRCPQAHHRPRQMPFVISTSKEQKKNQKRKKKLFGMDDIGCWCNRAKQIQTIFNAVDTMREMTNDDPDKCATFSSVFFYLYFTDDRLIEHLFVRRRFCFFSDIFCFLGRNAQ